MHTIWKSTLISAMAAILFACGAGTTQSTSETKLENASYFGPNSQMSRYTVSFSRMAYKNGNFVDEEFCTGVILTENWILTAAHCQVYGATIHFYKDSKRSGETRTILEQHLPDGITDGHYYNELLQKRLDLRLVKMDRPITLGHDYRNVKLVNDLPWESKSGWTGWVAGAGNHDGANKNPLGDLKWADAKVTEDHALNASLVISTKVNNGDSGGPFMRPFAGNNYELVGILSAVELNGHTKVTYAGDFAVRAFIYKYVPEYVWRDWGALFGGN